MVIKCPVTTRLSLALSDPSTSPPDFFLLSVLLTKDWTGADIPKNKMQRYRLDVSSAEGSHLGTSVLYDQYCEFPSINPKVRVRCKLACFF